MTYQEYSVHPGLQDLVECLWSLEMAASEAPAVTEVVIPDGRPELLVHYGCRYRELVLARGLQPHAFLHGQLGQPIVLQPTGQTGIVAARLRPHAVPPLTGVKASSTTGLAVPLDALWGKSGAELEGRVREAGDVTARVAVLEQWLLGKAREAQPDQQMATAVALVQRSGGRSSIAWLSNQLGLGRRQLERRFRDAVGLSPKRLARIVRVQSVLERARSSDALSWIDLALDFGYHDQAHLIRDFRKLTGQSPQRYLEGEHALADSFTSSKATP